MVAMRLQLKDHTCKGTIRCRKPAINSTSPIQSIKHVKLDQRQN